MGEHIIELNGICKSYDDLEVLRNLNLYINRNEFLTLLGPSGCGKTTTLRIVGGFEQPTSGEIYFLGNKINDLPPYKRSVNTVFQRYALFPSMTVGENIAFGPNLKKRDKREIAKDVDKMLELVNLPGFSKRKISTLSGGQQQRVAVARALINRPEVLLLDEPLGALDLKLRKDMQIELKRIQRESGITFLYVTHDQEEALTMSDTIVVMNDGIIQQIGTPEMIYNEPKNSFVADFIGESNILTATMICDFSVRFLGHTFPCIDKGFGNDMPVDVVLRPEDVELGIPTDELPRGRVVSCIFKGVHYEMRVVCGEALILSVSTKSVPVGTAVSINVSPENIQVMKSSEMTPDIIARKKAQLLGEDIDALMEEQDQEQEEE